MAPSSGARPRKRKGLPDERQTTLSAFLAPTSGPSSSAGARRVDHTVGATLVASPPTAPAEGIEDGDSDKSLNLHERAAKRQKLELERNLKETTTEYLILSHELDKVDITRNSQTRALNRWYDELAKGLRIRPNTPQEYTPTAGDLLHILEHDPYPGRRFELFEDRVELFTVRRKSGRAKCWRLVVQDKGRPNAPVLELFKLPERYPYDQKKRIPEDNALDTNVCPQRDEAIRLGKIVCDILNRIPSDDLDESRWGRTTLGFVNRYRKFVETTALMSWNPNFDFRTLSDSFTSPRGAKYNYTVEILDHHDHTRTMDIPGTLVISDKGLSAQTYKEGLIELQIPNAIDIEAIEALPVVPERHHFGANYKGDRSEADFPELPAIVNAHRFIRKELFGRCGTVRQFKDHIDDLRSGFIPKSRMQNRGIVNGHALWRKPKTDAHKKVYLEPTKFVLDMLYYKTKDGGKPIRENHLVIRPATNNRLLIAFIYQQGITAYASGKGLMNALQAMYAAASLVDMGELKEDFVKQIFCTCTEQEARILEHPCQHCFTPRLCRDLAVDEKGRRLCRSCAVSRTTELLMPTVTSYVSISLHSAMWTDGLPLSAKPALLSKLSTQIVDEDKWNDAYDGLESFASSTYRDRALRAASSGGRRLAHPRQPSIEKVYNFYVDTKGAVHLHHPENITLTKWSLNMLKALHIPSLLPFFSRAVRLTELAKSAGLAMSDHHAFFEAFDAASDNALLIYDSIPWSAKARLANRMKCTRARFLNELRPQYASGVWSGKFYGNPRIRFATRGHLDRVMTEKRRTKGPKEHLDLKPWSRERHRTLNALINQIEASSRFNPLRLKLPRGQDGAPWFFRAELMYDDHNYQWLFHELRVRLLVWDEHCNKAHDTEESPATLLVELAVQWFESGGGRCHLLGCHFTPYLRHPQVYSFGRGLTRIDEDGRTVDIIPGDNMRTGCTTTNPTDIYADYDIRRRTVIVETWVANRARYNFPVETMDVLRDCITSIVPETKWFEACKEKSAYRHVDHPKTWRRGKMAQLDSLEDFEDLMELADDEINDMYAEEEPLDPYDDLSKEEPSTTKAEEISTAQDEPEESAKPGVEPEGEWEPEGDPAEPAIVSEQGAKRFAPFVLQERIAYMINLRAEDCVGPDSPLWGCFLQRVGMDGSSVERAYPTWEGTFRLDENSTQARNTVAWMREDGSIVDAEGGVIARFDPFAGSAGAKSSEIGTPGVEQKAVAVKDAEETALAEDEMTGIELSAVGTQAAISLSTFAKLQPRAGMASPLADPADPDTAQADTVVSYGVWPNVEFAFPNEEREYVTASGRVVAVCNDEGQIIDREGNFLGQL